MPSEKQIEAIRTVLWHVAMDEDGEGALEEILKIIAAEQAQEAQPVVKVKQEASFWVLTDVRGRPTAVTSFASDVVAWEETGYVVTPLYTSPTNPEGWQPIETAPRGKLLLLCQGEHISTGYSNSWTSPSVTHWMPLPAAPKSEDGR